MKKTLIAILTTVAAALAVATYAGAGADCCAVPQRSAASDAATEKVATLHIEGMTCGSCATAVRRVLSRVDGVKAATVSYKTGSAVVTYDPAKVTPESIARAVEEKLPTYKAKVVEE